MMRPLHSKNWRRVASRLQRWLFQPAYAVQPPIQVETVPVAANDRAQSGASFFSSPDSPLKKWKKVALLGTGRTASTSYFLLPVLQKHSCELVWVSADEGPESEQQFIGCDAVIVVRYLPSQCMRSLNQFKRHGGEIVYFMDDDLMDGSILHELPSRYAARIKNTALKMRKQIESVADHYWVSTEYLANKYAVWAPVLVPLGLPGNEGSENESITVCYHGSASHSGEIEWLRDVVVEVQRRTHNVHFEFFGDLAVNRKFRELPRVSILHPMSWDNYFSYTSNVTRHIALAPLLPSLFNAGRGPTKFLDFARMNAVGLFTDVAPYRGFVRHEIDGLLLPNDREAWIQAIVGLAGDPEKRSAIVLEAQNRVCAMY